jgi:hypothetical protein
MEYHMTYDQIFNMTNMTGANNGAGTAYSSVAPEFTPGFNWGSSLILCDDEDQLSFNLVQWFQRRYFNKLTTKDSQMTHNKGGRE